VVENSAKFSGLGGSRHISSCGGTEEVFFFWSGFYLPLEMQPGSSVFLQGVPQTIEALVRKRKKINS
jgi:hypothetical protein